MSYETYKILHLLGIFLVLSSLGGVTHHVLTGGTKQSNSFRAGVMATHGVGLLLVLVSGFGALAKLQIHGLPLWAILKLAIWLVLGGVVAMIYRKPALGKLLWFAIPLLAAVAGALAITKPGA